jgi:hypothetical protein
MARTAGKEWNGASAIVRALCMSQQLIAWHAPRASRRRVDSFAVQGIQLPDRVRDSRFLVPPVAAVILHVLGGDHEDVLMHQRLTETSQLDQAANCLDACHESSLRFSAARSRIGYFTAASQGLANSVNGLFDLGDVVLDANAQGG